MTNGRDSMSTVTFGFSLVLVMSTVLFILVGVNPKNEAYSNMPWIYSGLSAAGSILFWVVSSRMSRPLVAK
jgi:hypothetical protein